ncbi:unnamed protein product [Mytilus coruscus]|uniref:YqaJ viral recombinase domain-containing protein n=1 Tax=Mytilus coruscus TaxID=42192 RepID=A0A6J8D4I0_MYTCO|nr:unnamed protein product [Mytilus coruscus]
MFGFSECDVTENFWMAKEKWMTKLQVITMESPNFRLITIPFQMTLRIDIQQSYIYDAGTKSLPDPYVLTEKWSTDPNTWPDLTFGDIYLYLIDTPSIFTKESMKAYKSLEAYKLGEVCSHVGALLFKVEMGVKIGMTKTSSTSTACQWNSKFRKEVTPATVTKIYDQIKGRRKKDVPNVHAFGSSPLPSTSDLSTSFVPLHQTHDVLRMREQTSPDNLVRRVCGYNSYDLSRKDAVRWGIEHEDEARVAYISHQKTTHINFECKLAGYFVNSKHPFVGASPDGIITCDCCGKGTLEVKCPFKHKDTPIDKVPAKDSNFCLDNMLQLKQNHRYNTQVQLQMYLTESSYSDFVVYTKCDPPSMVIVRLNLDLDFCKTLLSKSDSFVKDHVIHELITQKLNNMPVTQVNMYH